MQHHHNGQTASVFRGKKGSSTTENTGRILRLRWVCLGVEIIVKLLSERCNGGGHKNFNRKSIQNTGSTKRKAITILSDRLKNFGTTIFFQYPF